MKQLRRWSWAGVIAVACGCGSGRGQLGEVGGMVSVNGRPIAAGQIVLEVPGARTAQGRIIDGRIVDVTSYAPGDGAPFGLAGIAVFATESIASTDTARKPATPEEAMAAGGLDPVVGKSLIPARYNDPRTSGLTHDIVPGRNELHLELRDP